MKKKFSTKWKSSKHPRKQRKYLAKAPIHIKKKFLNANLSKELRKKHKKRSLSLRKGDGVRVMRGKFRGKKGKVLNIKIKTGKVEIEGIQTKKQDGSKVNVRIKPSNLQIFELNLEDKKRGKSLNLEKNVQEKKESKDRGNKQTKAKIKTREGGKIPPSVTELKKNAS